MMRVLMVNYEFPPLGGGTGVACQHLLQELAGDPSLSVDLVTSGTGRRARTERVGTAIQVHRLPVGKRERHFWRASELARWTARALRLAGELTSRERYDLCHCWAGWPPGLIGYRLRGRLPYVIGLRGSDVPGYNRRLRFLDPLVFRHLSRRVWRGAGAIVAVSENLKALARKTTDDVRIDVIRNGVDVSFFEPGEPPGLFTILFVGRLIERKGLMYLLEAFAALRRREPGARLLLAGEGPQRDALERHCRQAGLESSVRFLGQVERSSLAATYREASVFALPSLEEAMPNAVLEAMAAGLPIIATRTGAIELIDGNGILVDRASSESLERAFEQYLRSPELLRSHAKRSRELAETLSWGNVARAYREVYARVLRGPAS